MESIFDRDFYPTPAAVIERMLMGVEIFDKFVLEPSAGSGNIVDALNAQGVREVYACEINDRLRKTLSGKCTIIGKDFLSVTPDQISHIDVIVMNPPFSDAERHILHAYDIAPEGCEIISLCNTQTIQHPWKGSRQEVKELIAAHGLSERYGEVFSTAERRTDCDITCIRLWKPKTGEHEFEDYIEGCLSDAADEAGTGASGIMPYNVIRDVVNRYVDAVKRFDLTMSANSEINELTSLFESCPVLFGARWRDPHRGGEITRDAFKKELQKSAWDYVFRQMNMDRYVTKSVREDINRYVERQSHAPFTMHNIYRMLEMIVGTNDMRMKRTLVEAFDSICSFSAENSTAGEKWKTNSDYMINKRFIVPNITEYEQWGSYNAYLSIREYRCPYVEQIEDVIKALCYVTGTPYERTCGLHECVNNSHIEWGKWAPMGKYVYHKDRDPEYIPGFFRIRGYKKGTMHFEFADEDVWAKFNIAVAKIKGWQLPKMRNSQKSKTL